MSSFKVDNDFPSSKVSSLVGNELADSKDIASKDEWDSPFAKHRGWCTLVEKYTSCSLTKEEDKLMALAGLTQKYLETPYGRN
jgi:hypothetical protein